MFNIKFKGKYTEKKQIQKGYLPKNAIMFKEPNTVTKVFALGGLISLPFLALVSIGLFTKINLKSINTDIFIYSAILSFILMYVHEIIHALCFPRESEKEIWTKLNEGALFVYCNEILPKRRFIWMCAAPNVILGVIPYGLFIIGIFDFNNTIASIIGITSWLMILSGIGDYLNIYNAIRQVPKSGEILNYGFHSYWIN